MKLHTRLHLIVAVTVGLAFNLATEVMRHVGAPDAEASQATLSSPTTGTVSGLNLTNNFNNALDALNTCNSGASSPANQLSGSPSAGNCWLNTTSSPYPWQVYDGAGYRTPFWIDAVNGMTNVKIGGGTASTASASTVDLCSASLAPIAYVTITGNVSITSFGSNCKQGQVKIVTFAAVLTLTYNATSMLIPGNANVVTTAGDQAVLVSLGSGNWQVVAYTPANGQALINPAIDLGTYVLTSAVSLPSSKYLLAYGQAIARATYAGLMAVQTITQSVGRTNGSPTLTGFSDTTQIPTGAAVEGAGIPSSTTISSCTSTTCTMSNNASSSGTANVTIFPNGNGDGSTTFNLPNCQAMVLAGRPNMSGTPRADAFALNSTYYGTNPNALGALGGSQNHVLTISEMPSHNHSITDLGHTHGGITAITPGSSWQAGNTGPNLFATNTLSTNSSTTGITINSTGGGGPHSIIQPTLTVNCMMRVLAMRGTSSQLALNDNEVDPVRIHDRRRVA